MNTGGGFFNGRIARALLGLSNFIVLASSIILTGILSYFIHWRYRSTHWIYNEVIAVVTLFIYLIALFLPVFKSYRGYLLPLNLALTYLWLTSLIFSAQDFAGGRCRWTRRVGMRSRCGLKHAILAFFIIGFVFLLLTTILEALMWASHRRNRHHDPEKDRPLTTGPGTAAAPSTGERVAPVAV